jgi:tRNA G18 (ribose-2'-O)-methylase SpoU
MARRQLSFREERQHLEERIKKINENRHPISLLLDGVTNRRNLGSLFRIADAARLECIYGYRIETAVPGSKIIKRVARSAQQYVPYHELASLEEVKEIRKKGAFIGLEITTDSIPFNMFTPPFACTLIIGNEKYGISEELLELADTCIHIPMFGVNTSLNVSVATGIVIYRLLDKMKLL